MKRAAVKIAYLGKDFCGSQYQPELRTVIGDVYYDLEVIEPGKDREWFNLKASSRTDAGVNALDNVVVFNTTFDDLTNLLKALNGASKTIFYKSYAEVDDSFNPRFADERVYRYVIPSYGIDVDRARECSKLFEGEHDFANFCKIYDKDTVVNMKSVEMEVENGYIILTFRSMYFLWNMIRKISSAIISVGRGRHTCQDVIDALNGREINFGIGRPDALTLIDVIYNDVKFITPERCPYENRLREEKFKRMLENDFLSSL